jgi:hypothetical protein
MSRNKRIMRTRFLMPSAHSADNSPTLPLRVPPPPLYTRAAHQAPVSSTLTIPANPTIPPTQSPPKAPQVNHSPEHVAQQDTHLPPLLDSRPLSLVAEERVAQWVSQDAANQASRRSSEALPSDMPLVPSITVQDTGRPTIGQAQRDSTRDTQIPRITLSPESLDQLADRISIRVAQRLPEYRSQAGSSEQILDARLNTEAPLSLDGPPSSYRLGPLRDHTGPQQHRQAITDRSTPAGLPQTATHLSVPPRQQMGTDTRPRGTDVTQPTATGWMDSFYRNPPPSQAPVSPRQIVAVQPPSDAEPRRCTCPGCPGASAANTDVDSRPPPDNTASLGTAVQAPSNPIRITRKVSTTPPKLEITSNSRPLTERLREHVRAHPETGLFPTPDPVAEVGLSFQPGPELSRLINRDSGSQSARNTGVAAGDQSSCTRRSNQAATVETVYSNSEFCPSPPRVNRAVEGHNEVGAPAIPRNEPEVAKVSSKIDGVTKAASSAQEPSWTTQRDATEVRRPARSPDDSRGRRADCGTEQSDSRRDAPPSRQPQTSIHTKLSFTDPQARRSPVEAAHRESDGARPEAKRESRHAADGRAQRRDPRIRGDREATDGADIIEIPRRDTPERPAERSRVVSYTYIGDLDFADLPSSRHRHHTRDSVPAGESYRRTSTVTRKGRMGDTRWRVDEDEYESRDRRDIYATAPATSESRTRTVITEHLDVFGHVVRNEKSTTVSRSSVRPGRRGGRRTRQSLPLDIATDSSSSSPSPPAARRGRRGHKSAGMMSAVPMVPLEMVDPRLVLQFGLPVAWSRSKGSWYS